MSLEQITKELWFK